MSLSKRTVHAAFVLALPLVVALFGLSVWSALLLVILALLWRQAIVLGALMSRPDGPDLELETIPPSHFAERARWCLDRLGLDYRETQVAGIIGIFARGRTVPMLSVRTGLTRSSLCDSSHILRYLYGRYCAECPEAAAFLEPTPDRLEWERRLDRYGRHQQVWVYSHLLKNPELCKRVWGSHNPDLPWWQRWSVLVLYPVLEMFIRRAFQPEGESRDRAMEAIDALLADTEQLLGDGRTSLLGGETPDFIDITLASLSCLWAWPEEFAGGRFPASRGVTLERLPGAMRDDMQHWRTTYPATAAHIDRLYREERMLGITAPPEPEPVPVEAAEES